MTQKIKVLECPSCRSDRVERTDIMNENDVVTEFYECGACLGLYTIEYEAKTKEMYYE